MWWILGRHSTRIPLTHHQLCPKLCILMNLWTNPTFLLKQHLMLGSDSPFQDITQNLFELLHHWPQTNVSVKNFPNLFRLDALCLENRSLFWWYKRPKWYFFGMQKSFSVKQNAFFGIQKIVLDIFGGQRSHQLSNFSWHFGRSNRGKGGVQRSATQKVAAKAAESNSNINRKSTIQQKAQTTGAAQAEASCTNNKEYQTAATQEKSTKRISKSSRRSSTNNSKSSAPRGTHKEYNQ